MFLIKYIASKLNLTLPNAGVVLLKSVPTYSLKFVAEVLAEKLNKKVSIFHFDSFEKYRLWKTEYDNGFQDRIEFNKNEKFPINNLIQLFEEVGCERVKRVWKPGEFSLLGDVVIVWLKGEQNALRLSFFGDEIEAISLIDPVSFQLVQQKDQYVWGGVQWDSAEPDEIVTGGESKTESYEVVFANVASSKIAELKTLDLGVEPIPGGSAICGNDKAIVQLVNSYKNMGHEVVLCSESSETLLAKGIVLNLGITILTDYELTGKLSVAQDHAEIIKLGDYVVHEDHGIGIYEGLREQDGENYMVIRYLGEDRLLVPMSQSSRLSRYIGSVKGRKPKLTKLNGGGWNRTKLSVKKDLDLIAKELLQLYAVREISRSYKILTTENETTELASFIKAFQYKDTYDQTVATQEIIKDMQSEKPMDRLLIGDVGFGKTEVAMRAAFAAVVSGYQVAILAPTTVLVEQHKVVFQERFANFPGVKIKSFSRFNTKAERTTVINDLQDGKVNIVIGTHSLLSDAVKFKNLALIVVDEEQRFGVKHKEKIKSKKVEAHVLSMSATPIPRTLNLSLSGLRDISIIATPPANRVPIKNDFHQYDVEYAVGAIKNELQRQGQVYYLHNRIADIDQTAMKLMELYPTAKVDVAHGRMSGPDLTRVMRSFAQGDIDVLVCTTIIENGLDLPNVNTLIVDDVEKLGLSQMYQIRGRIGRSDRPAYAYFMYKNLKGDSSLRLDALSDFQDLGSGYLLSNRDLEIRGAGDILGDQQSGSINSVGYGLYMKLLADAVKKYNPFIKEGHSSVEQQMDFVEPIWLK